MILGPIFYVEMVTVARRSRYFVLRTLYALLILLVLWMSYQSVGMWRYATQQRMSIRNAAELATAFFVSFSWLQMLAILAVGPAMAVGTIATERERRTIEYLFATDLRNHEIILGKLCARLALLGKLVLVGLPILYIFRLMGGIPANLLFASFMLTGSTALFLASISVCVSVWSPRARDATVRVYVILAALLFLPMLFYTFSFRGGVSRFLWQTLVAPVVDFCLKINPIWTLGEAMSNRLALGSGFDMSAMFETVGYQTLISAAAVFLATFAVRRVHLRESSRGSKTTSPLLSFRLPRWRPALGTRPMNWKEMFAGTATTKLGWMGGLAFALILVTVIGLTLYAFVDAYNWDRRNDNYIEYLIGLTGFMGTCMLLMLATRASGLFSQEKERDTWVSLLSTPLTGGEIVLGKMLGNLYSIRWPFYVLLGSWALGIAFDSKYFFLLIIQSLVFLVLACYVTSVGLLFSLRSNTTLRAMGSTLGTLIFTGGGYMFCCCAVMFSGGGGEEIVLAPCIPFLLGFPAALFESNYMWREGGLIAAFVVGIGGYFAVMAIIYAYLMQEFDNLAQRGASPRRAWELPRGTT
jgi:ABC-type transport system involved in multi-copper enzyme maturation permease subunit